MTDSTVVKREAAEILLEAQRLLADLRSRGWTREDFARALAEMLDQSVDNCSDDGTMSVSTGEHDHEGPYETG